ncbi:MAG TPA: hypothetical protein VFN22_07870 [Gemmatimonadales bacterium]|nr:hypothetical protein [Gemmatimonadales bacterium]
MPSDLEQVRWARGLQALWLMAVAVAKVRGGVFHATLIPGIEDSARALLSQSGQRALLSIVLVLKQESPRQAEVIEELLDGADAKVRWFQEADVRTLPLAGGEALVAGSQLLEALRHAQNHSEVNRHLEALSETYLVLGRLPPLSE